MLIVSHNQEDHKRLAVGEMVESLSAMVDQAAATGQAVHEFERGLWKQLLVMGRHLVGSYFAALGPGDEGAEVVMDGQRLKRSEQMQRTRYLSIFGELGVDRWVYARSEKQRVAYAPLDQRAGLPALKYSYLLQDWSQHLVTELAYKPMQGVLKRFLDLEVSVAALETMTRSVAETVEPWCESQSLSKEAQVQGEQVTVLSADAKGVVMRGEAVDKPLPGRSLTRSGPTPGKCKMAVLGAAYTVEAFVRTPEAVLEALFGNTLPSATPAAANDATAAPRPKPLHKQVRAALSTDELGQPGHATAVIFPWLARQAEQRDPEQRRPCVLLIDGQHTLWTQAEEHQLRHDRIEILDLLHALGYLWQAVHLFHRSGSHEATRLMQLMTLALLKGQGLVALNWLAAEAKAHDMDRARRTELDKIRAYFEAHQDRIHYDRYLAQGLPIASGVIEGACRHVVNDRLNRTGMRWTLEGAQAMLRLRCVAINDLWKDLMNEHIRRETERLYPHREAADATAPEVPQVAA